MFLPTNTVVAEQGGNVRCFPAGSGTHVKDELRWIAGAVFSECVHGHMSNENCGYVLREEVLLRF
jgi:hypothetical protein